jgi:hypothetical protein
MPRAFENSPVGIEKEDGVGAGAAGARGQLAGWRLPRLAGSAHSVNSRPDVSSVTAGQPPGTERPPRAERIQPTRGNVRLRQDE